MKRGNSDSLEQELAACIREIGESARQMQRALMERRTDDILEAAETQQLLQERFRLICGGSPMTAGTIVRESLSERNRSGDGLHRLLERTRSALRRNRSLASAFLDVVDRTLGAFDPAHSPTGAYNAVGRTAPATGPRLLERRM